MSLPVKSVLVPEPWYSRSILGSAMQGSFSSPLQMVALDSFRKLVSFSCTVRVWHLGSESNYWIISKLGRSELQITGLAGTCSPHPTQMPVDLSFTPLHFAVLHQPQCHVVWLQGYLGHFQGHQ